MVYNHQTMSTRTPLANFVQGGFYHIYNRGNRKQELFRNQKDYKRYLDRLKEYKEKHNISIIAYCLMPNHIHLLLRQDGPEPISTFIHKLHTSYSMYFNKRYEENGHVFQDRFKSKIVTKDDYLTHLSRYIHLHPKNLVKKLSAYPWSSYGTYLKEKSEDFLDTKFVLEMFRSKKQDIDDAIYNYSQFVKTYEGNNEEIHSVIFEKKIT